METTTKEDFINCINPANGKGFFQIKQSSASELREKIQNARNSFPLWSALEIEKRVEYLNRLYKTIIAQRRTLAEGISKNTGKPIAEAYLTEIASTLQVLEFLIRDSKNLLSNKKIDLGFLYPTKNSFISYEPFGVIAIIEPWNYPFYLSLSAITKALICGNTVVFKPSSYTSYVGNLIETLFKKCDFPNGVINFIYGDGKVAWGIIKSNPSVDKVVFTGSVDVGREIAQECSKRFLPCSLELGGKDPAIVLKNSNLDFAANGILWGALSNCGQACASIERVYVNSDIYEAFVEKISALIRQLKIGLPEDDETDIGPLMNEEQIKKVESHINDAVIKDAKIHCGGKRIEKDGFYFEPTVLSNVNHSMKIMTEETFGPTIPIMRFDNTEEAIKLANDSNYGLAGSIWTNDLEIGKQLAKRLNCGTVWINDSLFLQAHPKCPWTGYKESSYGSSTIYDFARQKHISLDQGFIPSVRPKNFWWYPYKGKARSFHDLIEVVFKIGVKEKAKAAFNTFIDFLK